MLIGRSEHCDSDNGYSMREELARERYYERKYASEQSPFAALYDCMREADKAARTNRPEQQ